MRRLMVWWTPCTDCMKRCDTERAGVVYPKDCGCPGEAILIVRLSDIDVKTRLQYPVHKEYGDLTMSNVVQKEEAHKLVDRLPDDATWDDLMHEIYVRESIERGLADSRSGRTKSVQDVRSKYGLPE